MVLYQILLCEDAKVEKHITDMGTIKCFQSWCDYILQTPTEMDTLGTGLRHRPPGLSCLTLRPTTWTASRGTFITTTGDKSLQGRLTRRTPEYPQHPNRPKGRASAKG